MGVFNHETTRLCDNVACQGRLYDSIVNFGENLPEGELNKAFDNARKVRRYSTYRSLEYVCIHGYYK